MKHTKFLSVVLALLLAVALTQAVFVQSFAAEGEATSDECTGITVTSIEIINAPEVKEVQKNIHNYIYTDDLYSGLELLITFSDGTTGTYSFDEEDRSAQCVEDKCGTAIDSNVYILENYDSAPAGEYTVTYELLGCTAAQKIKLSDNPNAVTKIELTKLPDKVFEAPLYTEAYNDFYGDGYTEQIEASLDENNSVAANMTGAEFKVYHADGTTEAFEFGDTVISQKEGSFQFGYLYWIPGFSPALQVIDLGNYKARIFFAEGFEADFTANHIGADGEIVYGAVDGATDDEAITPIATDAPSTDVTSSTEDAATKDSLAPAKADNGTVATGSAQASALLLTVLVIAGAVAYAINRKKFIG